MDTPNRFQPELERCTLLAGFTVPELQAFHDLVKFEAFEAGDEILTEGQKYHGVWILLRGTCEVLKDGSRQTSRLATLEPASIFGEMSFLHPVPHSATVRAIDHVETLRLMREDFDHLTAMSPSAAQKLAMNIVRVLSDRLRRMDEWTCELVEKDCDGKRHQEWKEFRTKLYSDLFA